SPALMDLGTAVTRRQSLECSRRGERLEQRPTRPGPAYEVIHRGVGTTLTDALCHGFADPTYRGEPQPDDGLPIGVVRDDGARTVEVPLQGGLHSRHVDVRPAHCHTMAPGVGNERLWRPESHGLRVEQPGAKRRWVVQLQPRTR